MSTMFQFIFHLILLCLFLTIVLKGFLFLIVCVCVSLSFVHQTAVSAKVIGDHEFGTSGQAINLKDPLLLSLLPTGTTAGTRTEHLKP